MKPIHLIAAAGVLVLLVLAWFGWSQRGGGRPSDEVSSGDETAAASPYWSEQDRWVEVDGVRARVRVDGPEDGPVLVLIHGFSFSLESWDGWAGALSDTYRIIRMDLTGHGLTGADPAGRYSVPETVAFVGALLDAMGIESASLGGNSLGGLIAWRLAAERPDLVEKLVLISPGGYSINGVAENPVEVPAPVRFYLTQAPQPMIGLATAGLFGDASRMDPAVPQRVGDLMRETGVGDALVSRLEVFTLPDPVADLGRVNAPTLILWGDADTMVPPEQADWFVRDMRDARLIRYADLGHIPQEEDPGRTAADARVFLSE